MFAFGRKRTFDKTNCLHHDLVNALLFNPSNHLQSIVTIVCVIFRSLPRREFGNAKAARSNLRTAARKGAAALIITKSIHHPSWGLPTKRNPSWRRRPKGNLLR